LHDEISIISSEDRHYSIDKSAEILNLHHEVISVDKENRKMDVAYLSKTIDEEIKAGVKFLAVVLNMGSTMYGSVDDITKITELLKSKPVEFMIHIDAAFGGFIYPFINSENKMNFSNPHIVSFTLDAHKMLQAPYGTDIYLSRKGFIEGVLTEGASYVKGQDCTLSGSRSGANAISVWMILRAYGSQGGIEFCHEIWERTNSLCDELDALQVQYFRESFMNIVTISSPYISESIAHKYRLVPNCHENPQWWKIVVMDHVTPKIIASFLSELSEYLSDAFALNKKAVKTEPFSAHL